MSVVTLSVLPPQDDLYWIVDEECYFCHPYQNAMQKYLAYARQEHARKQAFEEVFGKAPEPHQEPFVLLPVAEDTPAPEKDPVPAPDGCTWIFDGTFRKAPG